MSYPKLTLNGATIELTPEVMRSLRAQLKEQLPKLTLGESMAMVESLGLPLAKILAVIREARD